MGKRRMPKTGKLLLAIKACIILLCFTIVLPLSSLAVLAADPPLGTLRITYGFPIPGIEAIENLEPTQEGLSVIQDIQSNTGQEWLTDEYVAVTMGDLPLQGEPGHPVLPTKTAVILLPYGTELRELSVNCGSKVSLDGTYVVEPGQEPYIL